MYERFTDRFRKVMQLANQEAQRLNHEYIDSCHILLGLLKEGNGCAITILKNFNVDLRAVREAVEKAITPGSEKVTMGKLPQTPQARKVIEYAVEEARNFNHNYIGTEHLLLGLIRVELEGFFLWPNSGPLTETFVLTQDNVRAEIRKLNIGQLVTTPSTLTYNGQVFVVTRPTLEETQEGKNYILHTATGNLVLPVEEVNAKTADWVDEELARIRAEFEQSLNKPESAEELFIPPPGGKLTDAETKINRMLNLASLGAITVNELRKECDMPPLPDGDRIPQYNAPALKILREEMEKYKADNDVRSAAAILKVIRRLEEQQPVSIDDSTKPRYRTVKCYHTPIYEIGEFVAHESDVEIQYLTILPPHSDTVRNSLMFGGAGEFNRAMRPLPAGWKRVSVEVSSDYASRTVRAKVRDQKIINV